jgi:group I intron endonuclease
MTIIYKYTNRVNGKVYVGKTDNELKVRHWDHCVRARLGKRTRFYNAVRKYGMEAFALDVIVEVSELGNFVEILFIEALRAKSRLYGYNSTDGGEGGLGRRLSESAKANLRVIAKTRPKRRYSAEYRRFLSLKMMGNKIACKAAGTEALAREPA